MERNGNNTYGYGSEGPFSRIPSELKALPQWVLWRNETRKKGKPTKVPYDPNRPDRHAATSDPSTWGAFGLVVEILLANPRRYSGLGFVFSEDDPYCGLDWDDCLVPETGEIDPAVLEEVEAVGSYSEVSPSGTGIKAVCRAKLPGPGIKRPNIEMYDSGRYFALTGERLLALPSAVEDAQEAVEALYAKYASATKKGKMKSGSKKGAESAAPSRLSAATFLTFSDYMLLDDIAVSGHAKKFDRLCYQGDWEERYPSQSEADLALCTMLAFWTGKDPEQIDRLFRYSALYRDKWERTDYREATIALAIEGCHKVYGDQPEASPAVKDALDAISRALFADPWVGREGPVDQAALMSLVSTAHVHGKDRPEGVSVCESVRDLAADSGLGNLQTAQRAIRRLEKRGWIEPTEKGANGRPTVYVLLHRGNQTQPAPPEVTAPLLDLRKIRNAKGRDTARGDGAGPEGPRKSWATLITKVALSRGGLSLKELSDLSGRRADNLGPLLRGVVARGLLLEEDEAYVMPKDFANRLRKVLEEGGSDEAEKGMREKHKEERKHYAIKFLPLSPVQPLS